MSLSFFHRKKDNLPSKNEIKRLYEDKLLYAKDNPSSRFDLSSCFLEKIPNGLSAQIKVLLKKDIDFSNNLLCNLDSIELIHFKLIKRLDLSHNQLKLLPDDIQHLSLLEHFNLSNNKLVKLPDVIGKLVALREFNISDNRIQIVPHSLTELNNLVYLNLSNNPLKNEITLQDIPPNLHAFSTNNDDAKSLIFSRTPNTDASINRETPKKEAYKRYANNSIQAIEKESEEQKKLQNKVLQNADKMRLETLGKIKQDDNQYQEMIKNISTARDSQRRDIVDSMRKVVYSNIEQTISNIEKNKSLYQQLAHENDKRVEEDYQRWKASHDDGEFKLRKMDILKSMNETLEKSIENNYIMKRDLNKEVCELNDFDKRLLQLEEERNQSKHIFIDNILKEESSQRQAFLNLQMKKDAMNQKLSADIKSIQEDLISLTNQEISRRKESDERFSLELHSKKRDELCDLLTQLYNEREKRRDELNKRLDEYQKEKECNIKDFWLIQYQRLMDKKPLSLEEPLDYRIEKILHQANAALFCDTFRRRAVKYEEFINFDENDLRKKICLTNREKIADILKAIAHYRMVHLELPSAPSETEEGHAQPSAPMPGHEQTPTRTVKTFALKECCICMESRVNMIFIPCGHACSCRGCGEKIRQCPMCREDISTLVFIEINDEK